MALPADLGRDGVAPSSQSNAVDDCPHCGARIDDAWLVCAACGAPVAAPAELPSGARLCHDRFEVLGVLGRGGFGITYDVMDHRLQRRVAVKELFPDSAVRHGSMVLTPPHARSAFRDARERFLREARVLARFTHSGIVRVYEVFEEHNSAYLVMELLEGRTLLDLLRTKGTPFREADVLDVAVRAAAALRTVHAAGVLHRDINPSNIVLTDHGRIVVIDFGIARSYVTDQTSPMTCVVTPGYAPIEQYVGDGRFGPASDVYGLAATLYRLATGHLPVAALEREGGKALPSPHSLNPAISKPVSDGLLDGLELNPDHRPQTLDAFLLRLGQRVSDARPSRSALLESMPPRLGPADGVGLDRRAHNPGPLPRSDAPVGPPNPPTARTPAPPDLPEGRLVGRAGDRSAARSDDATASGFDAPLAARSDDATVLEQGLAGGAGSDDATLLEGGLAQVADASTLRPSRTAIAPPSAPPAPQALAQPSGLGLQPCSFADPLGRVPIVGPHAPGRWKATVPLAVVSFALGSAAPVTAFLVLVLVALPLLATWGDSVGHRFRRRSGTAHHWIERAAPPAAAAPVRLVGNVVVSVLRSLPVAALMVPLLGLWYGLDRLHASQSGLNLMLRSIGLLMAGILVVPARSGSRRFRTGVALEDAVHLMVTPAGRLNQRGMVLWVVAMAAVAGSFWLTPEVWPLPG